MAGRDEQIESADRESGSRHAAVMATRIMTAKLNDIGRKLG